MRNEMKPSEAKGEVGANNDKSKEIEVVILSMMKFIDPKAKIEVEMDDDHIGINIVSEDSGLLIGHFGQTLDSVQYVVRMMINKVMGQPTPSSVDVAGYKANKEKELVELATATAENVKNSQYPQSLRPMNAYERRIVHATLNDFDGIETASVGEEPMRFIEIKPMSS